MYKKLFTLLATVSLISACNPNDIHTYGTIDENNKTIAVPAGGKSLKGDIKQALYDNDWELFINKSLSKKLPRAGSETRKDNETKYSLYIEYKERDKCFFFEDKFQYDIVLINNDTGSEVITMSGHDCETDIVENFIKEVDLITTVMQDW